MKTGFYAGTWLDFQNECEESPFIMKDIKGDGYILPEFKNADRMEYSGKMAKRLQTVTTHSYIKH